MVYRGSDMLTDSKNVLTPRERAVLTYLCAGLTATAIARRLEISASTVNKHLENVHRKLGTAGRRTTALVAHRQSLV